MPETSWTRRELLTRGGKLGGGLAVLAGAGAIGYVWPRGASALSGPSAGAAPSPKTPVPASDAGEVYSFRSRPDLQPPLVTTASRPVASGGADEAGYFFLTPQGYETAGPGQPGLMIVDRHGHLEWFLPRPGAAESGFDLQVQTYKGAPVLTFWQGKVIDGHGQGTGYVFDDTYRQIATVQAGNGLRSDLHELNLTSKGTALITAYRTADADLSALGGPSDGQVYACQAQEVDVATGRLLFSWDSLDHVPVTDSYEALTPGKQTAPYDYFHMNSVALAPDGDLLISSRNTWTVYKVSRATGDIVWRLHGRQNDFTLGKGVAFYWQHHVRAHGDGTITVFDDGASPAEEKQSRGLVLDVDTGSRSARLVHEYLHPARLLAANQGSVQVVGDDRVVVGWGDQPYFSEFRSDGTMVLDARLPADVQSYRALRFAWAGHPTGRPDVVVEKDTTGGATVYVSWNGATEVETWRVEAGKRPSSLSTVAEARRNGFETVVSVDTTGPYLAVTALDREGSSLGRSATVHST